MLYTLKCDPRTTADGFDCGEWDYLTYNQIYDHDATYDSTFRSHPNFLVDGQELESFAFTSRDIYNYYQSELIGIEHQSVIEESEGQIGEGAGSVSFPLKGGETGGKSYFILSSEELTTAGITAGDISGMALNVTAGSADYKDQVIKIEIANTNRTDLSDVTLHKTNFSEVYHYLTGLDQSGWVDFQFPQPYHWNGFSNLLVAISTATKEPLEGIEVAADVVDNASLYGEETNYALDFEGGGQYVNLGRDAQISGNAPRTIEMWAYAESFNGGGIFQAGSSGSVNRDFSLRTLGTDNVWRVQLWGAGDFDVNLIGSKGAWHHYAVVYDGSSCRLYYDGQLIQSRSVDLNTGENDIWIGRWTGSYFNGKIDEVRIWNTALTSSEIGAWMSRKLTEDHPAYENLIGYYPFNEGEGTTVNDISPAGNGPGLFNRLPWWTPMRGDERINELQASTSRPAVLIQQSTYNSTMIQTTVTDSQLVRPNLLERFENPANGTIIDDDSPDLPSLATSSEIVWQAGSYNYVYNPAGQAIDSFPVVSDEEIQREIKEWYSPTVVYEIGRFITPYGINLDLGSDGFLWTYDVTDYAELLKGEVDLSAGNNQELIDLKFMFIKGTPPREVKHIKQIWGPRRSYSYRSLDNDENLSETTLAVHPEASQFKVKTRITGHGHNSNDGSFPHCCEWKDNTHSLMVNGTNAASWKIFQFTECANNPVYPQGGTWPGAREGWCPGDVVKDGDIDITGLVSGDEIAIDYDITPVPLDNQGMGNGNYVMSMQLIQYGDQAFETDAELYDILAPSKRQYHSRFNPICRDAQIVVINNGNGAITEMDIAYWIKGGGKRTYTWQGNLAARDRTIVTLPLGASFWSGETDDPEFYAEIESVNGGNDMNAENNLISSKFEFPIVFTDPVRIELRTNNLPQHNTLTIEDVDGTEMSRLSNLQANQVYQLDLDYRPGCYTLDLLDIGNDGLSYWAFPGQGQGYLRIINRLNDNVLYDFEPEFGRNLIFSFGIFGLTDNQNETLSFKEVKLYPNPASDYLKVELSGYSGEDLQIRIYDILGRSYQELEMKGNGNIQMPVYALPPGPYVLSVNDGGNEVRKRFTVQR
jgi:hypothetical protein